MVKEQKLIQTTDKSVEMGRKISQMLRNRNKLQLIRNKWILRNEQIKMQKIVLNQLAKDNRLKKIFNLDLSLSKAIPDIA